MILNISGSRRLFGLPADIINYINYSKGQNNMKRILSIVVCTVLLFSLSACGSSADSANGNNENGNNETIETTAKQDAQITTVNTTENASTEKKEEGPDFSKAKSTRICSLIDEKGIDNFVTGFGTRKLAAGEELDFKTIEGFNELDNMEKKAIYRSLLDCMSEDYVMKNTFGAGYFKVERSGFTVFLLFVQE